MVNMAECEFSSKTSDGRWVCDSCGRPSRSRLDKPPIRPCNRVLGGRGNKSSEVTSQVKPTPKKAGLGDCIEQALTAIGITSERVEKWLGRPCNCGERKRKLNQLGSWATRIIKGETDNAKKHLDDMIDDGA